MGIYDREYYRDETSGSGWFSGGTSVCKTLILVNAAVFLAQWTMPDLRLEEHFAASSGLVFQKFQVWRLLTAAFLHDPHDPLHVLFNMWFLWLFGREMEAMYGRWDFTWMYLTGAVFSNFVWAVINYYGVRHGQGYVIGASGAVMAVMVLYAAHYPTREILLFFIAVPMWLLVTIYLGLDLFRLMQQSQGGLSAGSATAFAAHLGGGLYGFLFKYYDLRWSRILRGRGYRPKLRLVNPEGRPARPTVSRPPVTSSASTSPGSRSAPTVLFPEEQLDEQVDQILAKIARDGRGSLTDEENRVLQEASRRARDKRSDRV
jgi:membrane associated rhomboid family serine protease